MTLRIYSLLSPGKIFSFIWISALFISWLFPFYGIDLSIVCQGYILFLCFCYLIIDTYLLPPFRSITRFHPSPAFIVIARKTAFTCAYVWSGIFIATFISCGTFPLLALAIGSDFTYTDFSIPSLGGVGNLMRIFSLQLFTLIHCFTKSKLRLLSVRSFCFILFLFTPLFLTLSRGDQVFCLLIVSFTYFLSSPSLFSSVNINSLTYLAFVPFFGIAFALIFGSFQFIRHGSFHDILAIASNTTSYNLVYSRIDFLNNIIESFPTFGVLISGFILYITSSLANLSFQMDSFGDLALNYNFALPLFPTIIRDFFADTEPVDRYGLLISEAYNTSSFLPAFLKSFGVLLGFPVILLLLSIVSFLYRRSLVSSSISYRLIYPFFGASTSLSFFSNYFLILTVVLSPLLVLTFTRKTLPFYAYSKLSNS